MRVFSTCRTPCEETMIQGRDQCVARVSFDLLEITRIYIGCVFTGNGCLTAQALLSHFEISVHAALKLPK